MNNDALLVESKSSTSSRPRLPRIVKTTTRIGLVPAVPVMAFAVLGPLVLPYRVMVVRSGSMRPTIAVGALAIYRPVSSAELHPGDVIAFAHPERPGETVTHRIVKVEEADGKRSFVTKGDANGQPDAWLVPATGTGWRYRFSVPVAGYALVAVGSSLGRAVMLAVVVASLALSVLARIWRPARHSDAERSPTTTAAADSTGTSHMGSCDPEAASLFADGIRFVLAQSATLILGHSELLLRSMDPADPARHDVEAIHQAGERVAGVVRAAASTRQPGPAHASSPLVSVRSGSPLPERSGARGTVPRRPRASA